MNKGPGTNKNSFSPTIDMDSGNATAALYSLSSAKMNSSELGHSLFYQSNQNDDTKKQKPITQVHTMNMNTAIFDLAPYHHKLHTKLANVL